jgi:hypothetical protein
MMEAQALTSKYQAELFSSPKYLQFQASLDKKLIVSTQISWTNLSGLLKFTALRAKKLPSQLIGVICHPLLYEISA